MIRPIPFILLSSIFAGILGYLASYVPPEDLFSGGAKTVSANLSAVPIGTVAALKLRHASIEKPFDVGLFGNSRALAVTADDVGLPQCRYFNFSLSGQSLRSSIAMVETLAAMDRLPRQVYVSFDNLALQFYGNPEWLPLASRWSAAMKDILAVWREGGAAIGKWLRIGWRHLLTEGVVFRGFFEFRFIKSGVLFITEERMDVPEAHAYLLDGSLPFAGEGRDVTVFDVPASQVILGILRADLRRLARATNGMSKVVVYESPLAPSVSAHMRRMTPSFVTEQREAFLGQCQELGLSCMAASEDFAADQTWRDSTHAPRAAIGSFIRVQAVESLLACTDDL